MRTIYRRWRTFPCGRTSDGNRIASQIGRFFLLDLSCFVATGVPSHFRKQRTVSIGHASGVRFVSRAFSPFLPLVIASTANATLTRSHLSVSFYALVMHWSFYGIIYSVIKRITKSRPQQFSSKAPSKICEQKKVTGRGVRVTKTMKTHTAKGIGRDEWRKKSSTFGLGQTRKRGSMPSWSEARSWIHRSLSASPSTGYCDRTLAR